MKSYQFRINGLLWNVSAESQIEALQALLVAVDATGSHDDDDIGDIADDEIDAAINSLQEGAE